ncbi:phospholipid scramblase 2-like [Contarinia nasturtii]|uniref:phospholipid scramblase 2-like n=1 Tax=Contarinia nasturtii TaxID=265458 RepID=UPI0012D42910|nr:phospholipid scramblase 2-like [Contarinia nasturtii]XP_031637863.1 phospholipid scramblase 2-like [Contarinia nasturtii]XP_031637864.1 phospholipid scramblase 2-like [Contarinia nasturtii]
MAEGTPPPGYDGSVPIAESQPIRTQPKLSGSNDVIVSQPLLGGQAPVSSINTSNAMPICPPGLEYLTAVDQLLIKQKVEIAEAFIGFETKNKYVIKNSMGQNVFWAVEDTGCCNRNCCGENRSFDIKIFDASRREVLHFSRPSCDCACFCCCIPCCPDAIEVSSPPGNLIGRVVEKWSICYPQFSIKNQHGEEKLRIEGPLCTTSCCGNDVVFHVVTKDGTQIGKISKQWSGFAREYLTDADNFGVNFPLDLDVRMKATLLGACILMDMRYFEHTEGSGESCNCLGGLCDCLGESCDCLGESCDCLGELCDCSDD